MSILVKHGDPGVLVGLADAAGQLTGAGRVRDQVFQANVGDQSRRRASSDSLANSMALQAQSQAGQIAVQNNAAAIRQREIESVRRLTPRATEDNADPYTGGMVRRAGGRPRAAIPADLRYEDDLALKAAALDERRRRNLALEDAQREALALREAADRRRFDQADTRIDQSQQRVDQGQARVEQGAARVVQGDRRLNETERKNLAGEGLRRAQIDARAKTAPTRPRSYALRVGGNKKNLYASEMASLLGNDMRLVAEAMMPMFPDPLDKAKPATMSEERRKVIAGHDAALRLIGQTTSEDGKRELSLPAMQEVVERAASLLGDNKVAPWADRYVPVLEKQRNDIAREVVSTYARIAEVLRSGSDADAADAVEQAANAAGMTEDDYVESVEFLMEQGVIERPTKSQRELGAGPPPVAGVDEPQIEYDPATGQVRVKGVGTK